MTIAHLDSLSLPQLRAWLADVLAGRASVPGFPPDEPPDVAVFSLEHTLDKPTRRDLDTACCDLVRAFTSTGEGSVAEVRALLHLAVRLQLRERVAGALVDMALRFPELPGLARESRQAVLLTLVDLKALQKADFWLTMLAQDSDAFAGAALAGMLANSFDAGLSILPRLPERASFASAAAVLVDHALEDMQAGHRTGCLRDLEAALPGCRPALRDALLEVVHEYRADAPAAPSAERRAARLAQALRNKCPHLESLIGPPCSARLAA